MTDKEKLNAIRQIIECYQDIEPDVNDVKMIAREIERGICTIAYINRIILDGAVAPDAASIIEGVDVNAVNILEEYVQDMTRRATEKN